MSFVKYRYLIFCILGAAYTLAYFHRLALAVVAVDMMADLKTGGTLMGVLASAYFYPYALMQIPAGLLSDTWGPRRSVTFFFIFADAALGQPLIGWYLDFFGAAGGRYSVDTYSAVFKVCLIAILVALVTSTMIKETYPQESAKSNL